MEDGRLEPTPGQMREFGRAVVDMIVDHFETLPSKPPWEPAVTREIHPFDEPLPRDSLPLDSVLADIRERVLNQIGHVDHPRFFAFVSSPSNFVSVMADALISAYNVFAGNWFEGAAPANVERTTIGWLRELCGLPDAGGGLFVSGGTAASMTAIEAARHTRGADEPAEATIYYSDQTHSVIERNLRILGFHDRQLRSISSDESFRLSPDDLRRVINRDRSSGARPFLVIANAGTVNTGAVDPLPEIADVCQEEDLWLHVDGAYGAAAILTGRGRRALQGLERADSLALDPHKWLFQPYEIGCVLVRDSKSLLETYAMHPEYLRDRGTEEQEINYFDYGMQLTRSFRALKLYMSLKAFGIASFEAAIDRGLTIAEKTQGLIEASSIFEVVTPAQLGIVTFSIKNDPGRDLHNRKLATQLNESGFACIGTTELKERTVIRMCTINPRTTDLEIEQTIERLEELAGLDQ